jgi:hypothetical protein
VKVLSLYRNLVLQIAVQLRPRLLKGDGGECTFAGGS